MAYQERQQSLSFYDQCKWLTQLRAANEHGLGEICLATIILAGVCNASDVIVAGLPGQGGVPAESAQEGDGGDASS